MISPLPIVSLLIAMRNEEHFIPGCLASIFAQSYPVEKLEVLILDGMSSDLSWSVVDRLIQGKECYHLLKNPKKTQSAAWNLGISLAKGELITIVSAHSILAADYVSTAVETYYRTQADMVGGPMRAIGEGSVAKAVSIATSNPFGMGGAKFHYTNKEEVVDTVYMGFCSRDLYGSIGGFDEELVRNQDDELSYRILDFGGKIICNPAIRSQYFNRATLRSLWRQYYQYGLWKIRVLQKHPRQMRLRQFIPPLFVFGLILSFILTFTTRWGWILLVLVGGSYIIANLVASSFTTSKNDLKQIILLPITYAIIHLSYGSGFLAGLLKFWDRWGDKVGKAPKLKLSN